MQPAGRVDIAHRHREQQPPGQHGQPSLDAGGPKCGPLPKGVIAKVDRAQQGFQVRLGPGLGRRREQDDRLGRSVQGSLDSLIHTAPVGMRDHGRASASETGEHADEALADRLGGIAGSDDNDANVGVRQRLAFEVGLERVELFVRCGHAGSDPLMIERYDDRD